MEVRREWGRAKSIVRSLHYPVDHMKVLWQLLTTHHSDKLPNLIKLAQIALVLPLHTADCGRPFSAQNLILSKLRNRLAPGISDKLLCQNPWQGSEVGKTLVIWHQQKKRFLKASRQCNSHSYKGVWGHVAYGLLVFSITHVSVTSWSTVLQ